MFYMVLYMDIIIGGVVNTDNDYLLRVSKNFGAGGYLNFSDQLTIIVGNIFFYTALTLPFFVLWLSFRKRSAPFMNDAQEEHFEKKWGFLFNEFRSSNAGIFHYLFVFILRRLIFVMLCMEVSSPEFTCVQIFANIWLSILFIVYLIEFKPFYDNSVNRV
jgi:hypothetical protein